jgi:hypothetical protein
MARVLYEQNRQDMKSIIFLFLVFVVVTSHLMVDARIAERHLHEEECNSDVDCEKFLNFPVCIDHICEECRVHLDCDQLSNHRYCVANRCEMCALSGNCPPNFPKCCNNICKKRC